ncbi:MAG: hypothetical protein J6N18_05730 [Kiritimatiellae bacterium]|nr:hypothetical protein [Kiritimatiellia bacterium]
MKKKSLLTGTVAAAVCAAGYAVSADTVVIAPGESVETNVTGQIIGSCDVQINEGDRGGGIVRLSNDWNMYSGDTRVMCGMLDASVIRDSYKPSSLGRNATSPQTLYVGNGTLRYSGPAAMSSRRLVLDVEGQRHAAVFDIVSDLAFTGGARSESGTLLKTGSGTLTLDQPDGIWQMTTRGDGFPYPPTPTAFFGNGDSPESIYESGSLTVVEGRLAIKGGEAVTNYFGTVCNDDVRSSCAGLTYIGKTTADGIEHPAHLDIYGGYSHFGEYIRFDVSNGFNTAVNSSLNIYGGKALARFVEVGDAKGKSVKTCPELNVYEGGAAKIGYLHVARSKGSKGRVGVYGGRIDVAGAIYVANDGGGTDFDDPLLPVAHVTVASNGWLVGSMTVDGYSALTLRLASGGTYQFWSLADRGRVVVEGDGGTFRQTSAEATFPNTVLRIGSGGLTLYGNTMIFPGSVEDDPEADDIGPLTIDCGTAKFPNGVNFTGEIAVKDNRTHVLSGNVAATKVTMDSATLSADADVTVSHLAHSIGKVATFAFSAFNGKVKKLSLAKWDVPNSVNITLSGAVSGATYELMTVPSDCGVSASTFVAKSVNDSLSATFSVDASGDISTVSVTVGPAPAALVDGGSRAWCNAGGGDWATGSNWTEGTAPAEGSRTAVSFPTASSGEKTSVSLNKDVALYGLAFDAAPGYRVAGSGSVDVYKSGTAVVSSKTGTNAVGTAMTYSGALRLAAQLGGRLELSSLEGRGNVQLNDGLNGAATGLSGCGSVVVGNAMVNGTLTECNGLLEVGQMGPGVTALSIGFGLFRYTGGSCTLNGPLTASANNEAQTQIEITDPDTVMTVAGPVTQVAGAFTKRGQGTLVFAGDGENVVSQADLVRNNFSDWGYASHDNKWGSGNAELSPIDGSGSAKSFFGLSCAGGTLRWGKDGQKLTVRGGDLVVGTTTTASPGCEYDAEAEINGGETVVADGNIVIAWNHGNLTKGTPAKERLASRLTVNDGIVTANELILVNDAWRLDHITKWPNAAQRQYSTVDAVYRQTGGRVSVGNVTVGKSDGGTSTATVALEGGELTVAGDFLVAHNMKPNGSTLKNITLGFNGGMADITGCFYICNGNWKNPPVAVDVNGCTVRCKEFRAIYGKVTMNLGEGGVLASTCMEVASGMADNPHVLNWNGGLYKGTAADGAIQRWKTLNIGEKGAWLDTSEMTGGKLYFRNAVASASGAIHVCGDDPMRAVAFDDVSIGCTPVVVEPGGSAFAYSTVCASASATVCNDGAFGSRWTSTEGATTQVGNLTLGTNANDRTMLYFTTGSGYITPVKVDGTLAVDGIVEIAVMNDGLTSHEAETFSSKPILIAPKGTIDVERFEFTSLMPMVQATLSVESYDDANDKLVMTTVVNQDAESFSSHTWKSPAGGAWASVSNWDSMPNDQVDSKVVFTESLAGMQTIGLSGERTVGSIASAAQDLTLADGLLNVASTSGGKIETTKGTFTLPAVSVDANGLTLATVAGSTQIVSRAISTPAPATAVSVNPVSGSGTVRIAAPQNGQSFISSSGTLEGPASAFDGGKVTVNNATLRLTEGGFVRSAVHGGGAGMVLRVEGDVWFDSDVSASTTFIKTGPGTAYLGGSGSVSLGGWGGGSGETDIPANGDLPGTKNGRMSHFAAGCVALGLNDAQTITYPGGGNVYVGSQYVEFDSNGEIVQPRLDIYGGTVTFPNLRIGVECGGYRRISGNEGKILRPTMNIYGGTVTFGDFYLGDNNSTDGNAVSTVNLYGGTFTSANQWIAFGVNRTEYMPEYGQQKAVVNIYGGLLSLTHTADNVGEISKVNGDTDINLYGGEFRYAGRCRVTATHKDAKINIRFAGGMLTATELLCADFTAGGEGYRNLYWDGGTFKPTADLKELADNWSANVIGAGGAKFDLSAIPDGSYILNKPFSHDEECEGEDGGIELTAGGTLVLNAANEMNGPVVVRGGKVLLGLQEAMRGGLVLAGGMFDCNNFDVNATYLKGSGGEVQNGSVFVSGMIAPLDGTLKDVPYATVPMLAIGEDAVVKCLAEETDKGWSAPYFRVTDGISAAKIVLDFGVDSDVALPSDIRIKIAECGEGVVFPPVKGINYGIARGRTFVGETVANQETGMTDVYAVLRPMGTVVVFR